MINPTDDDQIPPTIFRMKFGPTFGGLVEVAISAVMLIGFTSCILGTLGTPTDKLIQVTLMTILSAYLLIPALIATYATHLETTEQGITYKHWPFCDILPTAKAGGFYP